MKDRFIRKYMQIAKSVGTIDNPCPSRQIGSIIVNPKSNRIVSTGYNGPPAGTPHCDSREFLEKFFWPQLTEEERITACNKVPMTEEERSARGWGTHPNLINVETGREQVEVNVDWFTIRAEGCGQCPRRLVNAGAGQRSDLCSCQHSERNAITNAAEDCQDCYMFCWCGLPCIQCAGSIINAGIKWVFCLQGDYYHPQSLFLFGEAGVKVTEVSEEWCILTETSSQ